MSAEAGPGPWRLAAAGSGVAGRAPTDESLPVGRLGGWSDLSRGDLRGDDGGVFAYPVQER
jgi:hypothetical protein